jgi:hypothetical protein
LAGFTNLGFTEALTGIVGAPGTDKNNFISLHTADPSGANEVTGGSYARVATNWGTPSGSSAAGSQVTINVPSGTTITHWGVWTASSAGNLIYGGALPASEVFGSAGTYSLTPTMTAANP